MAFVEEILGLQILAKVGEGARSTIYAVKDRAGQVYALKHVVKQTKDDHRFIQQALSEHRLAHKLRHPSLRISHRVHRRRRGLRLRDLYVQMEFVDGKTLEQYQPRDLIDLCIVCQKIAEGLSAMHVAGFVHADMKPKNVLVTDDGRVKLIDFGQSCRAGTVKKRIQGTPDYIAPEQVKLKPITPRTDVYNFGATMYWMLTGQTVASAMPKDNLPLQKVPACPAPNELRSDVPTGLSDLVTDCIKNKVENRPGSMTLVCERLALATSQLQTHPPLFSSPQADPNSNSDSPSTQLLPST